MDNLTETAKAIIAERYAHQGETPADVFERVAEFMARVDAGRDKEAFSDMLTHLDFMPNTPALANAGKAHAQMSACFVLPIDDELGSTEDGIFQILRKAALIQHTGGGNGFDFSRLRPRGSPIGHASGTKHLGMSTGPVSFIVAFNSASKCIAQGGIRRGANMAILRVDHPDIEQFMACKAKEGDIDCFNISVGVTDEFMRAVEADAPFDLRFVDLDDAVGRGFRGCIDDAAAAGIGIKVHKTVRARDLFATMTECSRKNGEPGIVFLDTANRANKLASWYRLEATNPCVVAETPVACGVTVGRGWQWQEAASIKVGDHVTATEFSSGHPLVLSMPVQHIEETANAPVYTAVFADGAEVTVTRGHQFYVNVANVDDMFASMSVRADMFNVGKVRTIARALAELTCADDVCVAPADVADRDFLACHIAASFVDARVSNSAIHARFGDYAVAESIRLALLGLFIHAQLVRLADGRADIIIRDVNMFDQNVPLPDNSVLARDIRAFLQSCNEPYNEPWTTRLTAVRPAGFATVYDLHEPKTDTWNTAGIVSRGCGEQWLGPYESCCLGSLNLARFVSQNGAAMQWDRLAEVTRTATRFLDNIVTLNAGVPSVPQIRAVAEKFRRIGLGVMGLGDMLMLRGLAYASAEGRAAAGEVTEFIRYWATRESVNLAQTRGPFAEFDAKRYIAPKFEALYAANAKLDWARLAADYAAYGIRNSSLLTAAPTGTISNVAGCQCSGCEPVFALVFNRRMMMKDNTWSTFRMVNPYFAQKYPAIDADALTNGSCQHLAEVSAADKEIYRTANEISWRDHVAMQAELQRTIDSSISKTINMPPGTTAAEIGDAMKLAWNSGCKGMTVYVAGSRESEVLTTDSKPRDSKQKQRRPKTLNGRTTAVETPLGRAYVTVNDIEGSPHEVFINASKAGSATTSVCEALGRVISLTLKMKGDTQPAQRLEMIANQLEGIGGGDPVGRGPTRVVSLPDGIAKALRTGDKTHHADAAVESAHVARTSSRATDICPHCGGASWIYTESCAQCTSCGIGQC